MEFIKGHWFLWLMLGIASILVFVWLFVFNRKKLDAKWWECLIVTIIYCLCGILGAVIQAFFEEGFTFGGTSLYGAVFITPLFCFIYSLIKKKPFILMTDLFSVVLAIYLAIARINCLHAGCCVGIILNSEKGIRFPAREADILFQTIFLIIMVPKVIKNELNGLALPWFYVSYGLFRFVNEWFREPANTGLHNGHISSMIAFVIGISIIIVTKLKRKGENKNA